jgi:hypothetical protein
MREDVILVQRKVYISQCPICGADGAGSYIDIKDKVCKDCEYKSNYDKIENSIKKFINSNIESIEHDDKSILSIKLSNGKINGDISISE